MKTRTMIIISIIVIAFAVLMYAIIPMIGVMWWSSFDPRNSVKENTTMINEKTVKIQGKIADEICKILGGDCPPFYPGTIQDNGSTMVGFVISSQDKIKHYQFIIRNDTLTHVEVTENGTGEPKQLGIINPEKDIPIFFEIQLMKKNIQWVMPKRAWENPDFKLSPPSRVCSQITTLNGTDLYISTIFESHYTLSDVVFHDTLPDDCIKVLPVAQYGRK